MFILIAEYFAVTIVESISTSNQNQKAFSDADLVKIAG